MAKTVAVMLAAVLLMSALASSSATVLSYGAIDNGDSIPVGKPGQNPGEGAPANGYMRGCEEVEGCRGGRKLLADLDAATDEIDLKQKIINFFH